MITRQDPQSLTEHPENPRRGDVGAIKASITEHGFYGVVVAQRSTGYVIAGNHRVRAAQELDLPSIPVHWLDCDDETARRILLVDNRTADKGGYDPQTLLDVLEELDGLEGTGYSGDDLDDLIAEIEGALVAPEQEFRGGYAETEEERQARQALGGATRESQGLVDVVLAYSLEDFSTFAKVTGAVKRAGEAQTTGQAVIRVLERATED